MWIIRDFENKESLASMFYFPTKYKQIWGNEILRSKEGATAFIEEKGASAKRWT